MADWTKQNFGDLGDVSPRDANAVEVRGEALRRLNLA